MSPYQHILAAVETTDEGFQILRKARQLAQCFGASLSVLHVVEIFPTAGEIPIPVDLTDERVKAAQATLAGWCMQLAIAPSVDVVLGTPKTEVPHRAEKLGADLLVLGHHPHKGWSLLWSHTDQAVLGRATCDLLAITHRAN